MSLQKAKIEDTIYDVISIEEYYSNPSLYGAYTAIDGGDGMIYPVRNKTDSRPGFYPTGGLDFFKVPSPKESNTYTRQNIIDFSSATGLRDVIRCQQRLMSEERSILTTIDSVFAPEIGENDTPEMKALKTAINEKHIDLDKYEPRFGPNYNNDKRLLRKGSVTFGKLRSICDALDIKATLIIEDSDPNVPNPIGRVITAEITGTDMNIEDDNNKEEEES